MGRRIAAITLLVLTVGVALRFAGVWRGLVTDSWREADYLQIARNFQRDSLNIFYPAIDWRGDTPGYVESEFPLLPWVAGALFRETGELVPLCRVLSLLLSIANLLLFARLARMVLPISAALVATAAFALHPMLIELATALQPEALMLPLITLAALKLLGWERTLRPGALVAAGACLGGAMLAKAPAAHLGLLFAFTVVRKLGWRASLGRASVWGAAAISIVPPLLWYAWSRHFWTEYGNSLGVSNETHLINLRVLWPPGFLFGNLKAEVFYVWGVIGWAIALPSFWRPGRRTQVVWAWYAATWVFYVLAASTSGDGWAVYYHCISVAPACLLVGAGVEAIRRGAAPVPGRLRANLWPARLAIAGVLGMLVLLTSAKLVRRAMRPENPLREAVNRLAQHVSGDARIAAVGGAMQDAHGYPVAWNRPMVFAWMDRRGFNYGHGTASPETLASLAARGARYWVAEPWELQEPSFRAWIDSHLRLVAADPGGAALYDLSLLAVPARHEETFAETPP